MTKMMQAVRIEAAPRRDLGEGMFRTSLEGGYLAVNPALADIYGYESPAQMMSELRDIQRQLYVEPGRRQQFIEAMARDSMVMDFRSRVHRRDGTVIWITEYSRAVRDEAGGILFYEGTVRALPDD